eukprot:6793760-Karenia_brevis.AAC.1
MKANTIARAHSGSLCRIIHPAKAVTHIHGSGPPRGSAPGSRDDLSAAPRLHPGCPQQTSPDCSERTNAERPPPAF